MNDIIFETLKLVIMLLCFVAARYLIPWLKTKLDAEKVDLIGQWATKAVLMAQQTLTSESGSEKKAVVTRFLRGILTAKNIALSDEQLDTLIESAVKQMKIEENKGIIFETVNALEEAKEG